MSRPQDQPVRTPKGSQWHICWLHRLLQRIRYGKVSPVIKSVDGGVVSEIDYLDRKGHSIGYWAYGSWDPSGPFQGVPYRRGRLFSISLAAKRTCWRSNIWTPYRETRMREDKILGISRVYHRVPGLYSWHVYIGRLAIRWGFGIVVWRAPR